MWCIKHPHKDLMVYYGVFVTRKRCIKDWESEEVPWKLWYRKGYRAVKVIIQEKTAPANRDK